jgi:hypothetical protein
MTRSRRSQRMLSPQVCERCLLAGASPSIRRGKPHGPPSTAAPGAVYAPPWPTSLEGRLPDWACSGQEGEGRYCTEAPLLLVVKRQAEVRHDTTPCEHVGPALLDRHAAFRARRDINVSACRCRRAPRSSTAALRGGVGVWRRGAEAPASKGGPPSCEPSAIPFGACSYQSMSASVSS